MKGKLIKSEHHGYILEDYEGNLLATISDNDSLYKLSLENCEAVFNGYDLDDSVDSFKKGKTYIQQDGVIILAGENATDGIVIKDPLKSRGVGHYSDCWNPKAFCEYNLEALEILGDKKFSEEDMGNLWDFCVYNKGTFKEGIQSLQQTEIEVEIVMETYPGLTLCAVSPELDENGCLILKRKA